MKETTKTQPQKEKVVSDDAKNQPLSEKAAISTCQLGEQETLVVPFLQYDPLVVQKKAELTEKRRKRCIPFVALALVLV